MCCLVYGGCWLLCVWFVVRCLQLGVCLLLFVRCSVLRVACNQLSNVVYVVGGLFELIGVVRWCCVLVILMVVVYC